MIAAITGALRIRLVDLAADVVNDLRSGMLVVDTSGSSDTSVVATLAPATPGFALYAVAA